MSTYDGCLAVGGASLLLIGASLLRRTEARSITALVVPLAGITSALIGARVLSLLLHIHGTDPNSGLSLDGGLVLGSIGALAASEFCGLNPLRSLDLLAPGVGIAIACSKVGCFLAGCCWGVPTHVGWRVPVGIGSPAHLQQVGDGLVGFFSPPLEVHPVQIYESAAALIGTLISMTCLRMGMSRGSGALLFAAWFFGFRSIDSAFRYPDPGAVISPQVISFVLFTGACAGFAIVNRKTAGLLLRRLCRRPVGPGAPAA